MARPSRIIIHWTAGGRYANAVDRQSYHYLVQQDGSVVQGVSVAKNLRNIPPRTPRSEYAAHTAGFNSWSVGVALCGMRGAVPGGPYGPDPITESQVMAMCGLVGQLCRDWDLDVDADTVFHHAEAQTIHGRPQAGKWDITEIPFAPDVPPDEVGLWLRARIYLAKVGPPEIRPVLHQPTLPESP
jgi:N-acetyl-anhydromuramyl-L-alanine amidase AmpD